MMTAQRRWRALGALATSVAALVLGGCGGGDSKSDGIPDDWELMTEFVSSRQTVWVVGDGESSVGIQETVKVLSAQTEMPLETEEDWIAALSAIAEGSVYGRGGPEVTVVDVDFEGAAVAQEYVSGNGELESLGVYIYDHGSDSLWVASALPGDGDIDPRFLDDFVRNFSPEAIAEASA